MKVDVEISLLANSSQLEELTECLKSLGSFTCRPESASVFLRSPTSTATGSAIGSAIANFLKPLCSQHLLSTFNAILRVGIFFNVEEAAFLIVALSREELKLIDELGLSIEISCYPCSPN